MFKVLSIDFDFFQNIISDYLNDYPDGIDYSTDESCKQWNISYAMNPCIVNTGINLSLFRIMKQILNTQDANIPVLIAQSHADAYSFIKQYAKTNSLHLVNVDLHHDFVNGNKELDCGNWISHIISCFDHIKFNWITRKAAIKAYGIKQEEEKSMCISYGLSELLEEQFDAVFICRSDAWLPPHLDTYFNELKDVCLQHFDSVDIEFCINEPRQLKILKTIAAQEDIG